jgi:hypothetical protein
MRLKIIPISVFLCLLVALCVPVAVRASGVAIAPMNIKVEDALRGAEFERVVTVFNPSNSEDNYIIRAEGKAANWLSFYGFESKQPIQKFTIPGASKIAIIVRVNIPPDVENAVYTATIYSETAPSAIGGDNSVSTILEASTALTIKVTGNQIQDGIVGSISAHDTEIGIPLQLEVAFSNTGNVAIQPKIDCQITKDSNIVDNFVYAETSVKPYSQAMIPINWVSPADQLGDFVAKVTVSIGEKILATREINFKIVPAGTFTKQGELVSLNYEGLPILGNMLKIQAEFKNTGEANTLAKSIAEVYLDGSLIDTANSEETLVSVGQTATLISYLKPAKTGSYTIKAFATYAGKQTATREISFTAGGEMTNQSGSEVTSVAVVQKTGQRSGIPITILGSVIGAIAVTGVTIMLLARKRRAR